MSVTRKDFTASRKHTGFYTRDLGDNGTGESIQWVEVIRKDGYALGAIPVPELDKTLERFIARDVPDTGGSIDDLPFTPEPEVERLEPPEDVEAPEPAPDAQPEVEVKRGRGRR